MALRQCQRIKLYKALTLTHSRLMKIVLNHNTLNNWRIAVLSYLDPDIAKSPNSELNRQHCFLSHSVALILPSFTEVIPEMKSSGMKQVTDPLYWYSNDNWRLRAGKKQICYRSASKSRRAALMLPTCILHWIYCLFLLWPSFSTGVFMIWDGHHSKEMFQRDVLCYSRATSEGQDQFYIDIMSRRRCFGLCLGFDCFIWS